jgi:hypothetical protein
MKNERGKPKNASGGALEAPLAKDAPGLLHPGLRSC